MNALRNQLVLAACLLTFHADVVGQAPVQKKVKVYNAFVSTVFKGKAYNGPLLEVKDSSITILSKHQPVSIPSNSIKHILFRRKASVGRGAALGGVTGFSVGFIIGVTADDVWITPAESGLVGGIVLSGVGSVVGVIIGAATYAEKIHINGDQKTFLAKSEDIRKYVQPR